MDKVLAQYDAVDAMIMELVDKISTADRARMNAISKFIISSASVLMYQILNI